MYTYAYTINGIFHLNVLKIIFKKYESEIFLYVFFLSKHIHFTFTPCERHICEKIFPCFNKSLNHFHKFINFDFGIMIDA